MGQGRSEFKACYGVHLSAMLGSDRADVFCFRLSSLAVLAELVADLRAVTKWSTRKHAGHVDKYVLPAILRSYETKPLVLAKEFNRTVCHRDPRTWRLRAAP